MWSSSSLQMSGSNEAKFNRSTIWDFLKSISQFSNILFLSCEDLLLFSVVSDRRSPMKTPPSALGSSVGHLTLFHHEGA